MREIANVFVGQAGIQMGAACCELLCAEHGIGPDGALSSEQRDSKNYCCPPASLATFFEESQENGGSPGSSSHYQLRALFVDGDPSTVADVRHRFAAGDSGGSSVLAAESLRHGTGDSGGLATSVSSDLLQTALEGVRRQAEASDRLQALFVTHSLGGGTGGGLTARLLAELRDELRGTPAVSFGLWPAAEIAGPPAEAYNTAFALQSLLENSALALVMDNSQLARLSGGFSSLAASGQSANGQSAGGGFSGGVASFNPLNTTVARLMSSWSGPLRFPGALNLDIAELCTNMVPFPNLHFVLSSLGSGKSTVELTRAAVDSRNFTAVVTPGGPMIVASLIYSGELHCSGINSALAVLRDNRESFAEWCPSSYKTALSRRPPAPGKVFAAAAAAPSFLDAEQLRGTWWNARRAVCGVVNTPAVTDVFNRTADRFDALRSRGTYTHWLAADGCSVDDLDDAREQLRVLVDDYCRASGVPQDEAANNKSGDDCSAGAVSTEEAASTSDLCSTSSSASGGSSAASSSGSDRFF